MTQGGNLEHIPKLSNSSVTKSHTAFLDPDQETQAKYSFTRKSESLARVWQDFNKGISQIFEFFFYLSH